MIDTDKYKGHTPSPWRVEGELTEGDDGWGQSGDSTLSIHGDGLYIGQIGADYGIHETHMNARLIADAPLLLAEVLRLREQVADLQDTIDCLREFCHKEGYDTYNWEVKYIPTDKVIE
jgi:hypothetical protein